MNPVQQIIDDLQSRVLAYEVMFQSIYSALPSDVRDAAIKNIEDNFAALSKGTASESAKGKLEVAKVVASRSTGAKL